MAISVEYSFACDSCGAVAMSPHRYVCCVGEQVPQVDAFGVSMRTVCGRLLCDACLGSVNQVMKDIAALTSEPGGFVPRGIAKGKDGR